MNLYLEHHGVKGMKWGVRRQQRKAEKLRNRKINRRIDDLHSEYNRSKEFDAHYKKMDRAYEARNKSYNLNTGEYGKKETAAYRAAMKENAKARNKYIASRLTKEFGNEGVNSFLKKYGSQSKSAEDYLNRRLGGGDD